MHRDFGLCTEEREYKEFVSFLFDKIKNDGKPFSTEYFDPLDKKRKTARMKLIESKNREDMAEYFISADAIEFYLDTKEIKDQSKLSIQQLLLEKMIRTQNYKGGIEVVGWIKNEVSRLKMCKNELLSMHSSNVFEGVKDFREFMDTGMKWFEDKQRLFGKNKELVERALLKAETELKRAISRYEELLSRL